MSASGNISVSFALQDSDVAPTFLTINIRSFHGSVSQHDNMISSPMVSVTQLIQQNTQVML